MAHLGAGGRWLLLGALLGALGWWLPWVLPRSGAAALVLLGLDLGEWWKFTGAWRGGLLGVERVLFWMPPLASALLLLLWVAAGQGWRRAWLLPLPLFLLAALLPHGELVRDVLRQGTRLLLDPSLRLAFEGATGQPALAAEYRFQFYGAALGVLLTLALPLLQRLPPGAWRALGLGVALAGALMPTWALWRTWLLLQGLYGGGALLGPGAPLSAAGFALAAAAVMRRPRSAGTPTS